MERGREGEKESEREETRARDFCKKKKKNETEKKEEKETEKKEESKEFFFVAAINYKSWWGLEDTIGLRLDGKRNEEWRRRSDRGGVVGGVWRFFFVFF